MRIKNVGKCTIVFKGGELLAGKVAVFKGASEQIGSALLKAYPNNLEDLDCIKKEDIVDVVFEDKKPEEKEPVKKVFKKKAPAKKSKK